jgi:polysaccharide biosynthesis transport protein
MKESKELIRRPTAFQDLSGPLEPAIPRLPIYRDEVDADSIEEPALRDYWRSVRKHPWLVVGIPLVCTVLAAAYLFSQPNIYEASVRLQVDLESTSELDATRKSSLAFDDRAYYNTQLEIINSTGLLRRVVKTLDVEHNQALSSALKPQVAALQLPPGNPVKSDAAGEDSQEALRLAPYVEAIQENLVVEPILKTRLPIKDTRLIDIHFTNPDSQIAAQIANTIAQTLVRSNLEKRNATNVSEGDFLQKGIADLQAQIRHDEEELINYAKKNQILSLDASQNTVVERLTGLNRQLLEAENERKMAESAYHAALAPGAAEALAEESAKQIAVTAAKLEDLQQRRAQLLVEATEKWPEVREIDKQIAVLEKQLQDGRSHATSIVKTNLETRYRQALAREQALRTSFDQQRGETLTQNELAVNYRVIQQQIETNKTLLDGFLQRSKANGILRAGTSNNINVIDYAIASTLPVGPKRLQYLALTLALTLPFGVGLALLREYLNNTVRSSEEVERVLNLTTLAVIPAVRGLNGRHSFSTGALKLLNGNHRIATGALKLISRNHQYDQSELLIKGEALSPLAEAYRQLRTSILLSAQGAPKTLLVTSSQPSEGKTTTAVNLAVSLAQTGANVLLIDADMRRPRLHSIFDMENNRGLSTILSGELSEAEVYMWVDQHSPSGLFLLPSGPLPLNPAELLGSEQMRRFLNIVESTFSYIIIDSPPIASFSDGVIISAMTDGVLLVVHASKIARELVQHSQKVLNNVGAKILGVVLNNVNAPPSDYADYYSRQASIEVLETVLDRNQDAKASA